jgi:hypothetical protein
MWVWNETIRCLTLFMCLGRKFELRFRAIKHTTEWLAFPDPRMKGLYRRSFGWECWKKARIPWRTFINSRILSFETQTDEFREVAQGVEW